MNASVVRKNDDGDVLCKQIGYEGVAGMTLNYWKSFKIITKCYEQQLALQNLKITSDFE